MSNWIIEPFSMTAVLSNSWKSIRLMDGLNVVGRSSLQHIFIDSERTSRKHAYLQVENGKLFLMDRSTNGTTVVHLHMIGHSVYYNNGTPIRMLNGDWISFDNPITNPENHNMQWFRLAIRTPSIQRQIERIRFDAEERRQRIRDRLVVTP